MHTSRFTKWVEGSAKRFEEWAKTGLNNGSLTTFYNLAGDVAARLGDIFSKLFGSINNIIKATFPDGPNSGAGGIILSWLDGMMARFQAFTSSNRFASWLAGASKNATDALSSIGKLLSVMTDLAAMPEIGQFWRILAQSEGNIRKMLQDGIKAGPAFAKLLNSLIQLITAFSDSEALKLFFNVLNAIVKPLADLFTFMKPVIDLLGKFHAIVLAISLATLTFNLAGRIFAGVFEKGAASVGLLVAGMTKLGYVQKTLYPNFMTLRSNYKILSGDAVGLSAKLTLLKNEFATLFLTTGTAKRSAYLLQLAIDAGLAKVEIDKLRAGLEAAQRQGAVTKTALASYGGNAAILAKAGYRSPTETAGARLGSFGRGAGMIAGAAGSMIGMSQPGASGLTQGLGMASMFAMLIPGIGGIVATAVLGIGSAISGLFDAQAQKEKDKAAAESAQKQNLYIQKAQVEAMTTQKFIDASDRARKEVQSYVIDAGMSKREAARAVAREQRQAETLGTEKGVSAATIDKLRAAIIDSGGPALAKSFAQDTKKSNEILSNAVNVLIESANGGTITDDMVSSTTSAVIDALGTRGLPGVRALGKGDISFQPGAPGESPTPIYYAPGQLQEKRKQEGEAYARGMQGLSAAMPKNAMVVQLNDLKEALATALPGATSDPGVINRSRDAQLALQDEYGVNWQQVLTDKIASLDSSIKAFSTTTSSTPVVDAIKGLQTTGIFGNQSSIPAFKIDEKDNTVKLQGADFGLMNRTLGLINNNIKEPPAAPIVNITIDEKFLKNEGWRKTGG